MRWLIMVIQYWQWSSYENFLNSAPLSGKVLNSAPLAGKVLNSAPLSGKVLNSAPLSGKVLNSAPLSSKVQELILLLFQVPYHEDTFILQNYVFFFERNVY